MDVIIGVEKSMIHLADKDSLVKNDILIPRGIYIL